MLYDDSNEAPRQVSVGSQPRTCPRPRSLFLTSSRPQSNLCACLPSATTTMPIFARLCASTPAPTPHPFRYPFVATQHLRFHFASFPSETAASAIFRGFPTRRHSVAENDSPPTPFISLTFSRPTFHIVDAERATRAYGDAIWKITLPIVNGDTCQHRFSCAAGILCPAIYISCYTHAHSYMHTLSLSIEIVTRTRYYTRKCEDVSFRCSKNVHRS